MGCKNNNKGKGSSASAATIKQCDCDHPFECKCGLRPPRPSRGHKWDVGAKTWGGKGHKQKGGSGQAAPSAPVELRETEKGKVKLKGFQKLPSELLANLVKRDGRKKAPLYRRVGGGGGSGSTAADSVFRFRLVLPDDGDNRDKDIVLTSACAVDNEEQAKEEVAILGLMYLYQALPHERTLPEPYRTTYLAAKSLSAASAGNSVTMIRDEALSIPQDVSTGGASTNSRLFAANVHKPTQQQRRSTDDNINAAAPAVVLLTKAQKDEAKRLREVEERATARKREAILEANKPMEVFMSAHFRRRIERFLVGDRIDNDEEVDNVDEDNDDEEEEDSIRWYVLNRLTNEGFNPKHIRKAWQETIEKMKVNDRIDKERMYEETLQYLCIHLREDQLPVGFDPRGGTLDVMSNKKKNREEMKCTDASILIVAEHFGLTPTEGRAIFSSSGHNSKTECLTKGKLHERRTFWKFLMNAVSWPIERTCCLTDDEMSSMESISDDDRNRNVEAAANECEAMEAIFDKEDFSIEVGLSMTSVVIALPFLTSKLSLEVHYTNGLYPDLLPMVFVTTRSNENDDFFCCGGRIHLSVVRFMSEISAGQEVIFYLFGHVKSLLQEEEASFNDKSIIRSELLSHLKLEKGIDGASEKCSSRITLDTANKAAGGVVKNTTSVYLRPREERRTFWNTPPSITPKAVAFPKLSTVMDGSRKSLPAAKAREEFLSLLVKANAISGGRVLLVTGETGCGKTTQIPQFILEHAPDKTKIIVAQPRRLAATGVANRVASERAESDPGVASVGYVVRGESKICTSTRLLFCTTGVLLRQLQSRNALECITHIVIDEVHERHLDSDVLLAILKQTLPSVPHLSVVLMSATMDADRFSKYFGDNTPRIHIPGFTHPVQDYTLDDVLTLTGYIPLKNPKSHHHMRRDYVHNDGDDPLERDTSSAAVSCTVPLIERLKRMNENEIDYALISLLIITLLNTKEDDGSILVFLSGAGEIDKAERAIQQQNAKGHAITILPLHGGLQADKQNLVFLPARKGYTKIILSTNIAETSITIPDCTIVVDTCKEKQSSYDPVNRMPLLLEQFASQDSLRQRRGRAGRVRPGSCYKLISSKTHTNLSKHSEPEIRRCALDQVILSLLFLGLEDGTGSFLRSLLDPPEQDQIKSALYSLMKIGAVDRNGGTVFLTPLGTHLAGIPTPPVIGKLLIMGCLLGCRDISVAIAASLSAGRSPFLRIDSFNNWNRKGNEDLEQEMKNYSNKQILEERAAVFKMVGNSDHVMLGKIFLQWKDCSGTERKRYCDKLGLAFNGMREIFTLTRQLDSSLTSLGFHPSEVCNTNDSSWRIVKSVLVASLSPTQIVRVQRPTTKYTETIEGAVEKDGTAKELMFFIRSGSDSINDQDTQNTRIVTKSNEERVFIHPSSNNFAVGSYSCPWIVYHRLIRTSKAYISDATECNPYSLLLFGGKMEVQASKGLIVLDDWIRLSANARIGSLIGGLREKLDELLMAKVSDPSLDVAGSTEMKLITE